MGVPVVIKESGGLPVTVSTNGYGQPMTEATNGFGIAVTFVASGGLPVVGIQEDAAVTDPHFADVVLLVGFDGADAATSATDDSLDARTLTFTGNAQIDTAQSKFGGASLLLDGSGDRVSAPDSADWEFAGEFTIEVWARFSSLPTNGTMVAHAQSSVAYGWRFGHFNTGALVFSFDAPAGAPTHTMSSAAGVVTIDTWYHLAVDRDASGKIRVYRDGTMVASKTSATGASADVAGGITIGTTGSATSLEMAGWLDEVRITKGIARYASDGGYTVPTAAFPRS